MPLSLSFVLVHVVFSTRERQAILPQDRLPDLHAYLAAVIRDLGCECFRAGGTRDHVHLAVRLARNVDVATLVEKTKANSSRWLKHQSPTLAPFAWQRGYGAFSVSPSDRDDLLRYIDDQETHHARYSFQEELRAFLRKYGVDADEKHLWD